jgi:hypothetical protein
MMPSRPVSASRQASTHTGVDLTVSRLVAVMNGELLGSRAIRVNCECIAVRLACVG